MRATLADNQAHPITDQRGAEPPGSGRDGTALLLATVEIYGVTARVVSGRELTD